MKSLPNIAAVALSAFALTMPAVAQAQNQAEIARGQQIAATVCVACHGADGNSLLNVNPHLAGQGEHYIVTQLAAFKSGARANPIMQGMVASLITDDKHDDLKAMGAYFSTQKLTHAALPANKELALQGQMIYRGGIRKTEVPACAGCHSPNGAGIGAQYPRLAGQWPEYTYQALKNYATDQRKHPVMSAIARRLNDDQMQALAQYTAGLR